MSDIFWWEKKVSNVAKGKTELKEKSVSGEQ